MASTPIAGRGWFIAGTALVLLAGTLHTIGQFTPDEPELASALAAIDALIVWHRDTTAGVLRAAALVNMVWLAAFIAVCWFYRVPPPLVSGIAIWPFFLIAWLRIR